MIISTKKKVFVVLELVLTPFLMALIFRYLGSVILLVASFFLFISLTFVGVISLKKLGLRSDNLLRLLPRYLLYCGITVAFSYIIRIIGIVFDKDGIDYRLIWLVFLSAVVQEIYYRGYLTVRLKVFVQSKLTISLIVSILFFIAHIILMPIIGYNWNLLIFSFFLSMWWTISYLNNPNLYLMILWHFVNNFVLYSIVLV